MVLPTSLYLLLATVTVTTQFSNACPPACKCHKTNNIYYVSCANQTLESLPVEITNGNEVITQKNSNSDFYEVFHNSSKVLDLDLSFNQLRDINLEDSRELQSLRYLNLQNNNITTIYPRAFATSPNLTVLNLAHNQLKSLSSAVFIGLHHLEMLDLHRNLIGNISDNAFLHTQSLISLDLSHNLIRDLPSTLFKNSHQLRILNLTYNQLHTANNVLVKGLKSLQSVDISNNEIQTFSSISFPQLENLDLSWNNISTIDKADFLNISAVKVLKLDGNPIVNISTSPFIHMALLETLSLSDMPKLYYLSARAFEGLHNLKMLNLSHNSQLSFIHKYLFLPLQSLVYLDLSFNNIYMLKNTSTYSEKMTSLDIKGNLFSCDCAIEWLVSEMQKNYSIIVDKHNVECVMPNSNISVFLHSIDVQNLHCGEVAIVNITDSAKAKLGKPVRFTCQAESFPTAEIVWVMPRNKVLKYYNYHPYSLKSIHEQQYVMDREFEANFHKTKDWYAHLSSYNAELESDVDRITILQDGSLYIHYVLRSDAGPYRCIAETSKNSTSAVVKFMLDYQIINEVKIWSIIVGSICAGSFFFLNLIVSLISAGVRKCVSQRRKEQIFQILESMDQYKTANLTRIKENYNNQVGRIRDQYHYQLGRLREHHHNKVGRIREGASQKVERMRENYNNQLGKLKDYSSTQLVQIREKYNNQILRIKDYGSDKFERIHEKYKLKQQHVIKLLEMMNLDNCRTVFESECVRTESMILHSDILNTDVPIHSPIDSESVSDSEYVTAANSEASSQENLYELSQVNNIPNSIPISFINTHSSIINVETVESNGEMLKETYETPPYEEIGVIETTITSDFQAVGGRADTAMLETQGSVSASGAETTGYNLMVLDPSALEISYDIGSVKESSV